MESSDESVKRGFETSDASVRALIITAILLVVGVALVMIVAAATLPLVSTGRSPAVPAGPTGQFTHGPDELNSIQESWRLLEREHAERFGSYGWVDRDQGIVRIPVERAIELMVQEADNEQAEGTRQ